MATQKIKWVEDNTAPPIVLTLERGGVIIDVTAATVNLIIARGNTITNTGHQACVPTTPTSGVVTYSPQVGDFPTPGTYKADVQIIYGDGSKEVLYDQLQLKARKRIQ
jgi:hypothetical protein